MLKNFAPICLFCISCAAAGADLEPSPSGGPDGGADEVDVPTGTGGTGGSTASGGAAGVAFVDRCGGCAADFTCSTTGACIGKGQCNADADCMPLERCEPKSAPDGQPATGVCVPKTCESMQFGVEALPPDVFITMDRSCSLNQQMWEGAVNAVVTLLTTFQGRMRWGLGLFPDTEGVACVQEKPFFAVGDGQEDAIKALLLASVAQGSTLHPGSPCVTNLDTAMLQASQDPAIMDPSRPGAVILITDGAQYGCNTAGGDTGTLGIISGLLAAGTPTFVVGFGSGVDKNALNQFAVAGGRPRTDPEYQYYQVDDPPTLQAALGQIAGQLVSCVFPVERAPSGEEQMFVSLGDDILEEDAPDGFTFDAENLLIELTGASCSSLQGDTSLEVTVELSCTGEPTR